MNSQGFVTGRARSCFFACFLILFTGMIAFAQAGRGGVSGTVTDPAGAVVPGAQVTLLNPATGVAQHTVTTGSGLYTFISLNPGVYRVTASQKGFASVAQDNITVNVDQVTLVNLTLHMGQATETVTVTETLDLVEPTNSTVGSLIGSETIDRVPLLYRNVYDLVQLSAGVTPANGTPNAGDSYAIENISTGRPGVDVSSSTINGAIVGSVYYMLDGSPLGIAENNAAAIIPSMEIPEDGVEEVRVETQNTPASYQSGGAGVISLVSKSGTNQFHGDVFGVFRPDVLSANEWFNKQSQLLSGAKNTPPSFHRYQEGGAIGGPIKKDKLFFFGDYEDTQEGIYDASGRYTVPTTAERGGDFSADPFTIYDPTQPDVGGLRQAFPGNKITNPNPIATQFLSMMPKCNMINVPGASSCDAESDDLTPNFFLPGLDPYKAHRFDVRVDWAASAKQRIFTRFSYSKSSLATFNAFGNMWDKDYAINATNGRNALVADDITLNSSTVLQLRYNFTRQYQNQSGDPRQVGYDITKLGFPAALAALEVYKTLPIMLFPDAGNSGVGGTANWNTFVYSSEISDANAAITKIHGKHEISTGFEWMKRYQNVIQPPAPSGVYGFDISATDQSTANGGGGSDFASALVGMGMTPGGEPGVNYAYPANFTIDVFGLESNPYYAAFLEDTYHATKALTITAGLRWDIFGGRNDRYNRQEYFDPNATNTLGGVSYTGAELYANSGNRSPYKTNMHDFGPRLGFSWQPVQHLVVRGGGGFYYGPSTEMVSSATLNTDGYSSSTPWLATCYNADGNTVFNSAGCTAPTAGAYTVPYSLSNPFPITAQYPDGLIVPAGPQPNIGLTLSTVLHSQRTPTTYDYNFGVEYEFPHQIVLSAGYVGSRGLFMPFSTVDLNVLDLSTIAQYGSSLCITNDPSCSTAPNPYANLPGSAFYGLATAPPWYVLEKYPQFGNGTYGTGVVVHGYPAGDSDYSSLQTKLQKRLTSHFTTLATFTWAKLITDDGYPPLGFVGTHLGMAQDWRDLQYEHSVSPQDVKYQFTGQASYDLPVGKGRAMNLNGMANGILGGWTVNGILYLSTGVPISSPTVGAATSYFTQRPDMTCSSAPRTVTVWFSYNCFTTPASQFIPGSAPAYLDHIRTMGARDLDLSIYKTFSLGEKRELRFEASSYNITNKAQFGMPAIPTLVQVQDALLINPNSPNPANFGTITSTINTPRQFQFGARFTF